jgi:hypothetical protein
MQNVPARVDRDVLIFTRGFGRIRLHVMEAAGSIPASPAVTEAETVQRPDVARVVAGSLPAIIEAFGGRRGIPSVTFGEATPGASPVTESCVNG